MSTVTISVTDSTGNVATQSLSYEVPVLTSAIVPVTGCDTLGPNPNYYSDWGATRVYRMSDVIPAFNLTKPKVIAVTDDPNVARNSLSAGAAKVRAMLENFYYPGGVRSVERANCEIHWANGNEVDREYTTGNLPADVIESWRLQYNAIHEANAQGVRRYPMASMGIDMTTWQVISAGAGPRFKPVAKYCDFVASSLYPTGRSADPVVWTAYAQYIDPILDMVIDWKKDNPTITRFACWEVGSPIDHAFDNGSPNNLGTTDWSIRPRYFAGGRAKNGVDYEGFLNYVYRRFFLENGIPVQELLYWNRQSDPDIPNPWMYDRTPLSNPDTATAWHNWKPGTKLPAA